MNRQRNYSGANIAAAIAAQRAKIQSIDAALDELRHSNLDKTSRSFRVMNDLRDQERRELRRLETATYTLQEG